MEMMMMVMMISDLVSWQVVVSPLASTATQTDKTLRDNLLTLLDYHLEHLEHPEHLVVEAEEMVDINPD